MSSYIFQTSRGATRKVSVTIVVKGTIVIHKLRDSIRSEIFIPRWFCCVNFNTFHARMEFLLLFQVCIYGCGSPILCVLFANIVKTLEILLTVYLCNLSTHG